MRAELRRPRMSTLNAINSLYDGVNEMKMHEFHSMTF